MYVCMYVYIYIYIYVCVCVCVCVCVTRLASNEIFSPSNKMHREVGRAKDLINTPVRSQWESEQTMQL